MNKIYQRIWSKVKERWILVNEKVATRGCPSGIVGAITLAALLSFSGTAFALDPGALPTGGKITSGTGTIATTGRQMKVTQSTDKMIANWNTFNIGTKAGVTFQQPDKNSVALNKIYDQNPSQILGTLSANGKIYLINPSGIVFGKGAQVNVGGLVASSLNMADSDFLAGKYIFLNTGNAGSVINKGSITAVNGGVVALIAPKVINEGTITANGGSVLLGAGNQVTLDFTGDGLISYTIDQGAVDALAENKGLIKADGGMVVMTAKAADSLTSAVVNQSGVIEAQTLTNKSGRILLMADPFVGKTLVSGTLNASAPNGGDGGFIETSGNDVKTTRGAKITALAPQGTNGTWLIDPTNFTIVSGSNPRTTNSIGATTLKNALVNANVTIATDPAGAEKGDINVNAKVKWSQNTLSLQANGDVNINGVMTVNDTAALDMNAGYDGAVYDGIGTVRVGFNNNGTFKGRVDFFQADGKTPRSGDGFLTINGNGYTVITDLGTEGSNTGTDLQGINGNLYGYYALGRNINASATSRWDSGAGFAPLETFYGQFNGLGHTISNLYINRPTKCNVGLFGSNSGNVMNVGLVKGKIIGANVVGALVGNNNGTINNSYSTTKVIGGSILGGLVGLNYSSGHITNSSASGSVTGKKDIGDITLSADASFDGKLDYAIDANFDGNTDLTASIDGSANISAMGSIKGGNIVGGLVGLNVGGTIDETVASGRVVGGSILGGLVGLNYSGHITNSSASGSVTGKKDIGDTTFSVDASFDGKLDYAMDANFDGNTDLTASIDGSAKISAMGSIKGGNIVGGLVGLNVGGTMDETVASGRVIGGNILGGLVGLNYSGHITNSSASGSVTGKKDMGDTTFSVDASFDGKLDYAMDANFDGNTDSTASIDGPANISAVGSIKSGNIVGGLVGLNVGGTINGTVASGRVIGVSDIGDLVGLNISGHITNSSASGSVTGKKDMGVILP